jgi:hypothetical protein
MTGAAKRIGTWRRVDYASLVGSSRARLAACRWLCLSTEEIIRETEGRVIRPEALVARLSHEEKHVALVAEAREILDTLRHTLSLARDPLILELKK